MKLEDFFKNNPKAAIAFSGGVDSAYLLYAAKMFGAEVKAYYVASEFQPEFEKRDALRLAEELGTDIQILPLQVLCDQNVRANPSDRCYYCKKQIFSAIVKAAAEDGFSLILDGSNASDDAGDRPGMRVLQEMSVRSPLRECGLQKRRSVNFPRKPGYLHGTNRLMPVLLQESQQARKSQSKKCKPPSLRRTTCSPLDLRIFGCVPKTVMHGCRYRKSRFRRYFPIERIFLTS